MGFGKGETRHWKEHFSQICGEFAAAYGQIVKSPLVNRKKVSYELQKSLL